MKTHYSYIVLGCGGIGSAALYWLAKRAGQEVMGIEQFPLFHHNGGSQDYSRIIRLAYHQEKYARLTPYTYKAWDAIAQESGISPVIRTGGVQIVFKDSPHSSILDDYAKAMDRAAIPYDRLDGDELRSRFPQFQPQEEVIALYQADTGIVDPSRGNAIHVSLARGYGATVVDDCPVISLLPDPEGGGVMIKTDRGSFTADQLIVTAGAWSNELLASVGIALPLSVTQEQVKYYATPHLSEFTIGQFPIFQWKDEYSVYGFPIYGEVATKAAIDASGHEVTARTRTFEADPARERQLDNFLSANIPNFVGPTRYTKTCLYTLPPDRDFILDRLPQHPNIILAIGAGHAYKFASLLGQILSELAIDGQTSHDLTPFQVTRPALTEPDFVPAFRI